MNSGVVSALFGGRMVAVHDIESALPSTIHESDGLMIATALHPIATGNLLPAYVYDEASGEVRPSATLCVHPSGFGGARLEGRGTHQAFGGVTNVQDCLHALRYFVEPESAVRGTAS